VKESKCKEDWTKEIRMQHLNRRHKKKQKNSRLKIKRSPKESAKKSNNGARQVLGPSSCEGPKNMTDHMFSV
jgi:protein subunit release factor B